MHFQKTNVLGISFYNGELKDACLYARLGGLITAPSGPGLAQDLRKCPVYRKALQESDMVLADSGLLCLWQKWIRKDPIIRISGLIFLKAIIDQINWEKEKVLWVMPDQRQAEANIAWLKKTYGAKIEDGDLYLAPQYPSGELVDRSLLAQIKANRPSSIFIQVGGGVQERLGLYLKENLYYLPSIYCTGAALAFLSGQQVRIPKWVDKLYLGWLLRCMNSPTIFIPRYIKAFWLIALLAKHRGKAPEFGD
tara:strand:+ start:2138 stop:2890 length:753 start_codon:yes stop_codon:yes gene_type:complete